MNAAIAEAQEQLIASRQTLDAIGSLVAIAMERARAVEQLSETEAERQGERLKSALLDSIAHDFRTPLTAIKAAATDLLASTGRDPQQLKELLTIVNEECDRLNHLVEEAAEMAKLESGEFELHLQPVAVSTLVEAALGHLRTALGDRRIIVNADEELSLVRVDRELAKDILVQLVDNANLYSKKEHPITITAEETGDMVTISVADRGPGIDPFEQGLIFDKFYRAAQTETGTTGGGLGLAICRGFLDVMDGTIEAANRDDRVGAVFVITLPAATQIELSEVEP